MVSIVDLSQDVMSPKDRQRPKQYINYNEMLEKRSQENKIGASVDRIKKILEEWLMLS